jgi:hypothetical protein
MPQFRLDGNIDANSKRIINAKSYQFDSWHNVSNAAGVVTVSNGINAYSPGAAGENVTDISWSGSLGSDFPLLVLRNSSTTNSYILKFDANKIRTLTGADTTIPALGAATFIPVSSSIVQQI